jgi:hypothetical protein
MEIGFIKKKKNIFNCLLCDYICSRNSDFIRHISTSKHIFNEIGNEMEINGTKNIKKSQKINYIDSINDNTLNTIYSAKKSKIVKNSAKIKTINNDINEINYDATNIKIIKKGEKCVKNENSNSIIINNTIKNESKTGNNLKEIKNAIEIKCVIIKCDTCNKEYHTNSGLWKHKKICEKGSNSLDTVTENINSEYIISELRKNQEFLKELLLEQNKNISELVKNQQIITNTTTNNISNKNTFNLNIFLNEKCKDAMNITDFVDSIKHSVQDVENIGTYGFIEGISKLFIQNLKLLSIYKRPIHCSDAKREILYVKDSNKWEKDENKTTLLNAIKNLDHKNIMNIDKWKKENPECNDYDSKKNEIYNKIMFESMSGESNNYNKIISNISKTVIIDKTEPE